MGILEDLMNQSQSSDENIFESRNDAIKLLTLFNNTKINYKVGDFVERNVWGKNRYTIPKKNQAAICTKILDDPILDEQGNYVNTEITAALNESTVRTYLADGRFYKRFGTKG